MKNKVKIGITLAIILVILAAVFVVIILIKKSKEEPEEAFTKIDQGEISRAQEFLTRAYADQLTEKELLPQNWKHKDGLFKTDREWYSLIFENDEFEFTGWKVVIDKAYSAKETDVTTNPSELTQCFFDCCTHPYGMQCDDRIGYYIKYHLEKGDGSISTQKETNITVHMVDGKPGPMAIGFLSYPKEFSSTQ